MLCDNIPGLVGKQRRLCRVHPDVMVSLGKGARLGVEECQYQFRAQRWNCSTLERDASVFGKVMLKGIFKGAFVLVFFLARGGGGGERGERERVYARILYAFNSLCQKLCWSHYNISQMNFDYGNL